MSGSTRGPNAAGETRRPNTINLGVAALAGLLDRFDAGSGAGQHHRVFSRWPFRLENVPLELSHPGGGAVNLRMACRNLSRGGLGLLHNAFVHPGSACRVEIPHPQRGKVRLTGRIVRCTHRAGVVHELGVKFDHHIDPREYVGVDAFSNMFAYERADPEMLEARVLHLEASELQRETVKRSLAETRISLAQAGTLAEAVLAGEECGAALLSMDLEEADPRSALETLRQAGFGGGVIGLARDASRRTRDRAHAAGLRIVLVRPLAKETLWRALAEVLVVSPSLGAGGVRLGEAEAEARLKSLGVELREAVAGGDAARARQACARLAELGRGMGWVEVRALADRGLQALSRGPGLGAADDMLQALLSACGAARPAA